MVRSFFEDFGGISGGISGDFGQGLLTLLRMSVITRVEGRFYKQYKEDDTFVKEKDIYNGSVRNAMFIFICRMWR